MIYPLTLLVLPPFCRRVVHTRLEAVTSWVSSAFFIILQQKVRWRAQHLSASASFAVSAHVCNSALIACQRAESLMQSSSFFVTARCICQWLLLQQTEGWEITLQQKKVCSHSNQICKCCTQSHGNSLSKQCKHQFGLQISPIFMVQNRSQSQIFLGIQYLFW